MIELLTNYKKNIKAGTITDESNFAFINAFVNIIIGVPQDLRETIYCNGLWDLLLFEYKQWKETKSRFPLIAIYQIVSILKMYGVVLSAKTFDQINKQFTSVKSRAVIDFVYEIFKESWEETSCITPNIPHVTNALLSYLNNENARQFIEQVKNEKQKQSNNIKSNVFNVFMSYEPQIIISEPTEIAKMLAECTLINYNKNDIKQYKKYKELFPQKTKK